MGAAFDYEFSEFLQYWDDTMSDVCDQSEGHYCYLVDSSAFLLYFQGIETHLDDEDISHKFLGDAEVGEPALMQSLLENGFFVAHARLHNHEQWRLRNRRYRRVPLSR